jgi:hypothetical protein
MRLPVEVVRSPVRETSIPDQLLPEQYFARIVTRAADMPEKRLMAAVLLDAVIHMQRRGSTAALEAESWIRGEEDAEAFFSFRNICEALGIDPGYLARGLLGWQADQVLEARGSIVSRRHVGRPQLRMAGLHRRRRRLTSRA